MPFIKFTGYIEVDEADLEPEHTSGLKSAAWDRIFQEVIRFRGWEDPDLSPDDRHPARFLPASPEPRRAKK